MDYKAEISRIGCGEDSIGPVASLCADESGEMVRIYDDYNETVLHKDYADLLFESLPDNAGWKNFWYRSGETETLLDKPCPECETVYLGLSIFEIAGEVTKNIIARCECAGDLVSWDYNTIKDL